MIFAIFVTITMHFGIITETITFKNRSAKTVAPSFTGMQRNHTVRADFIVMAKIRIVSPKHGIKYVFFDEKNRKLVSKYRWRLLKVKNGFYANAHDYFKGVDKAILMHRLIMGFPDGVVDHEDHNGLNNFEYNLRPCTIQQNCRNQSLRSNNTSGYKGVSYHSRQKKYQAYINDGNRKYVALGCYKNPIDAAKAYNSAAKRMFGKFAHLNKLS